MEVTPEMIEAVRLHELAERDRQALENTRDYERRQKERNERQRAGALAQARTVLPDLTEEQFTTLADIFSEYVHDRDDW